MKQTKAGTGRRGMRWSKSWGPFRFIQFFHIAASAAFMLEFQSLAHAQGNLINLFDWTDNSRPYRGLIDVFNNNSGVFEGAYANSQGQLNQLNLTGQISTTPGAVYDVSFTLQDVSPFDSGIGSVTFGSIQSSLDYAFSSQDSHFTSNGYQFYPVTYNFTAVAASSMTSMTFDFTLDQGMNAEVSGLTVTEAPEVSSVELFGCGAFAWLFVRHWRQIVEKRKLAPVRAAKI